MGAVDMGVMKLLNTTRPAALGLSSGCCSGSFHGALLLLEIRSHIQSGGSRQSRKHEKTDPVQHIILRQLFSIAISSQAPPPPRTPFANFSFSSSMKCTLTNAKGTLSVNLNFFHLGFWHRLPVVPTNRPEAWRRRRRPRPFRHLGGRRQGVEEPRRQGGTQDKNRWDGLYDGTFSALAPIQSPARSRDCVRGGAP